LKAVPGRATDVKDAEWIADVPRRGLVRPSFAPDREPHELRELGPSDGELAYRRRE
jgi:hypothetical protein